jgi:hypothetical protein
MIGATRLPLHPRPLPYEALSSWVDRLAAAYDLQRYEFLRAMFGADPSPDTADLDGGRRPDLIATFADRTGFLPERVRAMTLAGYTPELIDTIVPSADLFEAYVGRFGWFMPVARRTAPRPESSEPWIPWRADDLLDASPRCCRRCLIEDTIPYVRLHWRLAWMACCPQHGEMLVPSFFWPSLRHLFHAREADPADPDLLALDRITLGAVTIGKGVLPESGATVSGGAWLRALRTLIDELVRPLTAIGRWARDEVTAAWRRAGSSLDARQSLMRRPYEQLRPEQRVLLLRVAAAAVQNVAVRRARPDGAAPLRICVTQWDGGGVCRT